MVMRPVGLAISDMDASRWCPLEEARPLLRELGLEDEIEARLDLSSPYHDICNLWLNCGVCNAPMTRNRLRGWHQALAPSLSYLLSGNLRTSMLRYDGIRYLPRISNTLVNLEEKSQYLVLHNPFTPLY